MIVSFNILIFSLQWIWGCWVLSWRGKSYKLARALARDLKAPWKTWWLLLCQTRKVFFFFVLFYTLVLISRFEWCLFLHNFIWRRKCDENMESYQRFHFSSEFSQEVGIVPIETAWLKVLPGKCMWAPATILRQSSVLSENGIWNSSHRIPNTLVFSSLTHEFHPFSLNMFS